MPRQLLGYASLLALVTSSAYADAGKERAPAGAVFTIDNQSTANHVLAFARNPDGSLAAPVAYATGGEGSGDGLSSQGALALSEDHRFLLVVDAGSNELSSFAVSGATLSLRDRVSSGGMRPVSVTTRRGLVYVLNAGVPENVSGFYLDRSGRLSPLPGATAALSATNVGAAQVELDVFARALVVAEKTTNLIDVFAVGASGRLGAIHSQMTAGTTPFGFEFTDRDELVISEAASASLSAYALGLRGLVLESGAVPDTQAAPCWVAIARDDRVAFTANAGSASISSYTIARDGTIVLANARAGEVGAGSHPLDMAQSDDGRMLYVLDHGNLALVGFAVGRDGSLTMKSSIAGPTPASSGLAAY